MSYEAQQTIFGATAKEGIAQLPSVKRLFSPVNADWVETRWGGYINVCEGYSGSEIEERSELYKVKLLAVRPGGGVSIQAHQSRREEWRVLEGTGVACLGSEQTTNAPVKKAVMPTVKRHVPLHPNVVVSVAKGQVHFLRNNGIGDWLLVLEVQVGEEVEEEDIVRFGDPCNDPKDRKRCTAWLVYE